MTTSFYLISTKIVYRIYRLSFTLRDPTCQGMGAGWACATQEMISMGVAHPGFSLFEIVWMRTATTVFCAKRILYYDNYSIRYRTKQNNICEIFYWE